MKAELKEEIKKDLNQLEKELKSEDKDAGIIQKVWKRLKKNASWVAPILAQVVLEGLKLSMGEML